MEKIFIWGTGTLAVQAAEQCDIFGQYDVIGFIDNDINKCGQMFLNRKIFTPDVLNEKVPDRIVILTACYKEIEEQINREFPQMADLVEKMNFFYKRNLMRRYQESDDPEILQILEYLSNHDLQIFNYDFADKYERMEIDIKYDEKCEMFFVYYENKRLYFAKSLKSREEVEKYYRGILMEQDKESPHKYTDENFQVQDGDVVVDIGVAEGNFSLQIVDRVSKLYLIETDEEWIEALEETFKEYGDKVVIIKKFVTSLDSGKYATLDSLIKEPVDFIKMDIEGNEWDALQGAKMLIAGSDSLRCSICAYHGDFDEILIKDVLAEYGMESSTTKGYMWFPFMTRQTYVSTRLCRGVIRAVK